MNWHIGPWMWSEDPETGDGCWSGPAGTIAAIDFRTLVECGTRGKGNGSLSGVGLFSVAESARVDSEWEPLGSGDWTDLKPDGRLRDMFPRRSGVSLTGDTLADLIRESFATGDPRGEEFAKPMIPTVRRELVLACPGMKSQVVKHQWADDAVTNRIRDVLQYDLKLIYEASIRGELKDAVHHRRVLDDCRKKYGVTDDTQFVEASIRRHFGEAIKRETSYLDDFNRANEAALAAPWSHLAAGWGLTSNQARTTTNICYARYDADLSSSDHEVSVLVVSRSGAGVSTPRGVGPMARHSSSALTGYIAQVGPSTNLMELFSAVGGTLNFIATAAPTVSLPATAVCRASGSTIEGDLAGANVLSVTNTAVSSGLRGGLKSHKNTSFDVVDDFLAADLGGGGPTSWIRSPFVSRVFRSPVIRGVRC